MLLALAIVFLWMGGALLFVAFHPLGGEDLSGKPSDAVQSIKSAIDNVG
ncbi:MAG: hypothetical protein ACJ786_36105 [Catenulispora sp.]|jgi:hypothetical protein